MTFRLHSLLGSGEFGEVYRATWNTGQTQVELAVKTLNAESSNEDRVKFLQEAAIMGQFRHTNVIKMHGIVTIGEPVSTGGTIIIHFASDFAAAVDIYNKLDMCG